MPTRSTPSRGAVVVLLTASGTSTHVQVISVDDADNISEAGVCPVSLESNVRFPSILWPNVFSSLSSK